MFASILSQAGQFVSEPLWWESVLAAVVSLMAVSGVSSAVTGLLRRFTDTTGLDPRILVWIVAAVVTGIAYVQAPLALPEFDSANPGEFVAGWLMIATSASELSKALYDRLLRELPVFRQPSG